MKSVDQAIKNLRNRSDESFDCLFKTITSENISEFSGLHPALQDLMDVYLSHVSWDDELAKISIN